jgi:peptide chain release factor 1
MFDKLIAIREKYLHLEEQLADPGVLADMTRWSKINKEYKDLGPIVAVFGDFEKVTKNLASAREMLEVETDDEMRTMAKEEIYDLEKQLDPLESELKNLLVPKDPEDEKDVIVEIRSGTGGDEASIFAGDLYRMYGRYFNEMGWEVELIDENPGTAGGYSKLILEVTGAGVYGKMKFESGAHRVQRVPETESKGRVHTSAATVAVMPKVEFEDINIRKEDIRTDLFRASGAGGQHVNKTESGVRFTHLPTGAVAESTESRSQHKNRGIAMGRLVQLIQDTARAQVVGAHAEQRRSLVGSGDRSEKIRTYNYPQNRVTDHRLEGDAKNYSLENVMNGGLPDVIESLIIAENAEKMRSEAA